MCIAGCNQSSDSRPSELAGLSATRSVLENITKMGSVPVLFGAEAAAFAYLQGVNHHIAVLQTGKGLYKGTHSGDAEPVKATDCTIFVLDVLESAFTNQGRTDEWTKVKAKAREYTKLRKQSTLSGIDIQAALQSVLGWNGIFWAPDPKYPSYTWRSVKNDEQSYAYDIAKNRKTYYRGFVDTQYPGVSIDQLVVNYAPESGSSTTQDTANLEKLRGVPFGVLSAHGGYHMCLICYGKVCEVHWSEPSTSAKLFAETPLETWGGLGNWGSGAIVVPTSDFKKAWP
jgi:hypothetical protein